MPNVTPPRVFVGGNNCTVVSASDSEILCLLPSGTGHSVSVIVVTSGKILISNSVTFSYDAPTIGKIVPTEKGTLRISC